MVTFANFARTSKWEAVYVNKLWYPFDEHDPRLFAPVCILHMYQVIIYMVYFTATDAMILMVIIQINQHFNSIAIKMSIISSTEEIKSLVERYCRASELKRFLS